jgi:hypothetical protein
MPRVAYTEAQKAEAVALSRVVGVDLASEQLGIDFRTIRKWATLAGEAPDVAAPRDVWQRLLRLAGSKTEAALNSGKMSPAQMATIAAIATRNLANEKPVPAQSSIAAQEAFLDWLCDSMTIVDLDAAEAAVSGLQRELLRRANAEGAARDALDRRLDPEWQSLHRLAVLAWYSHRPDVEADDVLDWAKAQTAEILAEHGSLEAWHVRRVAEDAKPKPLPPHVLDLLAQAEAYLETDDAA